jgi:hypothetical protein
MCIKRWEDRINYGAEDYGGMNTLRGLARDKVSFASNMVRKVSSSSSNINKKIKNILKFHDNNDNGSGGLSVGGGGGGGRDDALKTTTPADDDGAPSEESLSSSKLKMELKERMFWGLSTLWEEGLVMELRKQAREYR